MLLQRGDRGFDPVDHLVPAARVHDESAPMVLLVDPHLEMSAFLQLSDALPSDGVRVGGIGRNSYRGDGAGVMPPRRAGWPASSTLLRWTP